MTKFSLLVIIKNIIKGRVKTLKDKKMKKSLLLNLIVFSLLLTPMLVLGTSSTPTPARELPESADLVGVLKTITNWLFTILMAGAAIAIVAAAFLFISSGGDSEKMGTARTWVLYALIGVLVALLAQVLVNFVDNMIT